MLKVVIAALLMSTVLSGNAEQFLSGADMSLVGFFETRGVTYRSDGQPQDVFDILKERGLNAVRLRLFTSSPEQAAADPYNYINNLEYTLPLAVRTKSAGLKLVLDFHYSDTWADPGHQRKPDAWTNLTFIQLQQQLHDYSSNCIAAFKAAGALPDYVQVGNEITSGLLWTEGQVGQPYDNPTQWGQYGELLNAAIQGIKEAGGPEPPKIIIHLDRGGDWAGTQWHFDNLNQQAVPYDIIGQSYYPWWHGDLSAVRTCLSNAVVRYGKPIMVMETAFPWTNSTYDPQLGIPLTPEGQVDFAVELAKIVKGLPDNKGIGLFWWGAEYVRLSGYNLAGFHRTSFFDYDGDTLPVVETLGQLTAPVTLKARLNGAGLELKWPLSGAGLSLRASTNLAPAGDWSSVTDATVSTGAGFRVTVPVEPVPEKFFRLEPN